MTYMPFGSSALASFYNGRGFTLTFNGKHLTTGIAAFDFHLLPMSPGLARTPFGAQSSWQGQCDFIAPSGVSSGIAPGDILVMTRWNGWVMPKPRRFKIDGVAEYPNDVLPHINLALTEQRQS